MESSRGPPRVKNKAPAPQQISAEQLLREAVDRQEPGVQAPTQRFADLEELHEYQGRKRKEFEDYVRRNRINMNNWMRYAAWELEQREYNRCVVPSSFIGRHDGPLTKKAAPAHDPSSSERWTWTPLLCHYGSDISRRR